MTFPDLLHISPGKGKVQTPSWEEVFPQKPLFIQREYRLTAVFSQRLCIQECFLPVIVYSGISKPRGCFSLKQQRGDSTEDQSRGSGISQTLSSPSPAEEMQVLERIFMERCSRINPSRGWGAAEFQFALWGAIPAGGVAWDEGYLLSLFPNQGALAAGNISSHIL